MTARVLLCTTPGCIAATVASRSVARRLGWTFGPVRCPVHGAKGAVRTEWPEVMRDDWERKDER